MANYEDIDCLIDIKHILEEIRDILKLSSIKSITISEEDCKKIFSELKE